MPRRLCRRGRTTCIRQHGGNAQKETKGIYENDRMLQLHKSQDNPYITELYGNVLGEIGGHKAHTLLHTSYHMRKRITDEGMTLSPSSGERSVEVNVCFGTGCFLKGSQKLLHNILEYIKIHDLSSMVNVSASFCFEKCDKGPVIRVGEMVIEGCTVEMAMEAIERETGGSLAKRRERPWLTEDLHQIVFTLTARCRDCYRCLRSCPVKAIRMDKGQAYVDEKRCIACGTCIRECPQQAKTFRHDIDVAQRFIDERRFCCRKHCPFFCRSFQQMGTHAAAFRSTRAGFRYVGQTSQGAYQVSDPCQKACGKRHVKILYRHGLPGPCQLYRKIPAGTRR